MDDPQIAQLTLPTDPAETVKPAKGFSVVATTNATPDALPFALRDRFPVCINVNEVNPKALENLSEDLRTAVQETVVTDNEERRISIRAWAEFDKLRKEHDEEMVAQAIFGHKATDVLNSLKLGEA
jgi:MoxR-like ATPase